MAQAAAWLAAIVVAVAPVTAAGPSRAPHVSARTVNDLPRPLPAPYDAQIDAHRAVAAAQRRARASGKPLLIDFGANWCADCRVLAGVLELPEMRKWIAAHFELVQVDVGEFDRNLDIPAGFGAPHLEAIPAVLVVDARTSKLRNRGQILALGDARIMQPQQVADWLAKWTR